MPVQTSMQQVGYYELCVLDNAQPDSPTASGLVTPHQSCKGQTIWAMGTTGFIQSL